MSVEYARHLLAPTRLTPQRLAAVPAALGVVLGVGLAMFVDGQRPAAWGVVGCALAAITAAVTIAGLAQWRIGRPLLGALGCGAGLVALGLASMAWSPMPGDALEEGTRGALYLLAFGLPLLRRWTPADLRRLLWLVTAAVSVVGLVVVARGIADEPSGVWAADGRLVGPIGYVNATASLWLLGFVPALGTAIDPRSSRQLAGAALGAAVLMATLIVLTQSRGATVSAAVATMALLVVTRLRVRSLLAVALVAAALAGGWSLLSGVRDAANADHGLAAPGSDALLVGLALSLICGALWSGLVGLRQLDPRLPSRRLALLAVAVAAVLGLTAATGNPISFAGDRWHDLTTVGYGRVEKTDTRLAGGLGSNRPDFYRVALHDLRAAPLHGDGLGGFRVSYLERRRSPEAPRYVHSEPLDVATALGIPGLLLAIAALGLALRAAAQALRRSLDDHLPQVAALTGAGAVLLHACFDWTWAFPAIALPAMVLLGAAARGQAAGRPRTIDAAPPSRAVRIGLRTTTLLLMALFLVLAFGSAAQQRATDLAGRDPDAAIAWARRAAKVTPSSTPVTLEGLLELRRGRFAAADAALTRAVDRTPDEWFARLERAIARSRLGRLGEATGDCRAAMRLYPSNGVVRRTCVAIADRRTVDPIAVERDLYAPTRARDAG